MKRGTVMKKNEINIAVNNDFLRSVSDVLSQARKNAKNKTGKVRKKLK